MENDVQIEDCCYICAKRSFHTDGIYCGLTQFMVDYADCCEEFLMDETAKKEMMTNIKNKQIDDQIWENMSDFDKFLFRHTLLGKMMYFNSMNKAENEDDSQLP